MVPMSARQHKVRLAIMTCLLANGFKQQGTSCDRLGMAFRDGKAGKQ